MAKWGLLLSTLLVLVLSLSITTAITPIAPTNGEETLNQQPLFSWTDYAAGTLDNYTLIISQEPDMTPSWQTFVTTTPYHQLQAELAPGTWYWQVTAQGTTTETTPINELVVLDKPSFTINPDTSQYDNNYRVDFLIDAPLGSKVSVNITKQGFDMPFSTNNLQTTTFTTFLEPGDYTITAAFSFEGARADYADILSLTEPTAVQHVLSFNITDSESDPLDDARIKLTGEEHNYSARTDENGTVNITVEEDYYEFLVTEKGFFDDEFNKKITSDKSFRIRLVSEEMATATASPTLTAVAVLPSPEIIITNPTYKEVITELPLTTTFTLTEHASVDSCDLLFRTEEQQGWTIADTSETISQTNTLQYLKPEKGESLIKIQCTLKGYEKTVTSEPRTIIISPPPEHHEAVQVFLDELQESVKSIPSSNDPLFLSLDVQGKIAEAKKQVVELDNNYIEQLTKGNEEQATTISNTIDQELARLRSELITTFSVVDREDTVIEVNRDSLEDLVKEWLSSAELTDKQKQTVQETILEDQTSYTIRVKTSVARIDTLDGNQQYVTGVTRTLQQYYTSDEPVDTVTIIEEIPSYFLQQTGTPKILGEDGKELATIQDEHITLSIPSEGSYTLLFSGNVKSSIKNLDTILILKYENATAYLDGTNMGALSGVTGAVVNVLGNVGRASPLIWVFVAIVIATLIINPFTTVSTRKNDKRVTRLTDTIHDTLDLMERGMPEQAFQTYPVIIEAYEQLKPDQQEALSFAISNLSTALNVHTINSSIAQSMTRLNALSSRAELIDVHAMIVQLIDEYQELDAESRTQIKPSMKALQQQLKEKHAFLTSSKPRKNYPLP